MSEPTSPLLDNDGSLRLKRFAIACVVSAIGLTVATALLMHTIDPDGGWGVAWGVGAMIGFWMCPLGGAVFGNGFHELSKERGGAAHEPTATVEPQPSLATA